MNDVARADDAPAVLNALYRQVESTPGVEILLNAVPVIDRDNATVSSVSVVFGGDVREPRILRCRRVTDRLQRATDGRWQVHPRNGDEVPPEDGS
jgi:hypothetical protein